MASVAMQRDLVVAFKKETLLNVGMLSKLQPMPADLSRQIFKENGLEKPTQNLFNHLSYYLVSIIDTQVCNSLSWPLYDTKTERAYRNELSVFIIDYSNKGLLSPVMSSYLVNPGCYKVTLLMFQMTQIAVQKVLLTKMNKDSQKKLYSVHTENYKTHQEDFIENIEKVTITMSSKFSNYIVRREMMENIAGMFSKNITEMEEKMSSLNPQKYINNIVDGFLKTNKTDDTTKVEISKIKDISKPCKFLEACLEDMDTKITEMEQQWDERISPLLKSCQKTQNYTELLITRQTGQADKSTYTLEYNPKSDDICTNDLQNQVNSEQKYILKNITKDGKLIFPNLVRGFLISICFILRNAEISDEIYKFNEYLNGGKRNFNEIVCSMRILLDRVVNAEARLQPTETSEYNQSISLKEFSEIPPLPDLSELKMGKDFQAQLIFDTFTPLHLTKHQFNLRRKAHISFTKPRSLLLAPMYQGPRDDFLKSLISCRISAYDRPNTTQQSLNMSIMSQNNFRNNETIAECSSGFTKQQIMRLLSTKKSSSSKKFKYRTERPENVNIIKGGLFNDSCVSSINVPMQRSHSSPNLLEHREKRSKIPIPRKLSIMQENSPLLEVSGISALDKDNNSYGTPEGVFPLESTRRLFDATSLPVITVSPEPEKMCSEIKGDSKLFSNFNLQDMQEKALENQEEKTETPKNNTQLIRKTSSLEKIINRFKKVRASVLPCERTDEEVNEFKTIVEEKENLNLVNVDVFTANRVLLPDLVSPRCSVLPKKSSDHYDELFVDIDDVPSRKPRESLGTALGVDHTFLDQFELLD